MKINNKSEKKKFLEMNIPEGGSFALVTYDNHIEPIWITRYKECEEWGVWFLESLCELHKTEFEDNSENTIREFAEHYYEKDYVEEGIKHIKSMLRDGWFYEIENFQTAPFLPDKLDDLTLISEQDCLEWMLNQKHLNE